MLRAPRLFSLAFVGGFAWFFLGRRRKVVRPSATIGFADGSSVTLEVSSPEYDRLLHIAEDTIAS